MSKSSASRFRFLFFTLTIASIIFALIIGWMIWKFYPILRKQGGVRQLFSAKPFENEQINPSPGLEQNPPDERG